MAKKEKKEHPTVFISYSHDEKPTEHIDKVLVFANRLRGDGIDAILDQYEVSPPEGWPMWMDRNIRGADFVLMICTETYFKRVTGEEELGKGRGVKWEGRLIYQHFYNSDGLNEKFIPILFSYCKSEHVPVPFQSDTYYAVDTEQGYEALYRRLTNQPRVERPELKEIRKLPPVPVRERREDYLKPSVWFSEQWPVTDAHVFGREDGLKLLDKIWEKDKVRVASFVAAGGVGKTALVNRWVNYHMMTDDWRGAECVFGWSFYSQGSEIGRQVSGDDFIKQALLWFGDEETANSTTAPAEKGRRLAELIKKRRTLLLLDGMEPLQEPPGSKVGHDGQIRDAAVSALVRSLARGDSGLCVISTRVLVEDIISYTDRDGTAVQEDLDDLIPEKGAEYLRSLGVHGTKKELLKASEEYGNHALALTLLGNFLKIHREGDVCKRAEIANVIESRKYRDHARRVMAFYEKWFEGQVELELLYVLGLFDRPVEKAAIDAVCGGDAIKGLTEKINGLPDNEWSEVLNTLREARLVAKGSSRRKFDCHPLVREHFGEKLKQEKTEAWREGHDRLYEYYKSVPEKEQPDTVEEMGPLYRAVGHGCCAGRYEEALREVYWGRIQRGEESYNINKIGAIGSELAAIAGFFAKVWERPVDELSKPARALVLNIAGYDLRALGRLGEAVGPMKAGLDMNIEQEDWVNAAIATGNISELELVLGEMEEALRYGKRSVEFADQSGDKFWRFASRTALADALHQSGRAGEAKELFKEAEKMQKEDSPQYPFLYTLCGFRYCDLLLAQGRYKEVLERASQTLEWVKQENWLLDIALDHLSLGRAYLQQVQKEGSRDFRKAGEHLTVAVDGLRKAGTLDELPRGLLGRAELWRVTGDFAAAQRDLDEAFGMAGRCGMRLYEVDCYIGYARLSMARGEEEKAKEELGKAKELIGETGYRRREDEVEGLFD